VGDGVDVGVDVGVGVGVGVGVRVRVGEPLGLTKGTLPVVEEGVGVGVGVAVGVGVGVWELEKEGDWQMTSFFRLAQPSKPAGAARPPSRSNRVSRGVIQFLGGRVVPWYPVSQ
jgi:hypothetical protein